MTGTGEVPTVQFTPAPSQETCRGRPSTVKVLAVTPYERDRIALETTLPSPFWTLHPASSLKDALACIQEQKLSVVICERDLPDGTWLALLEALVELQVPPKLIVCSRLADESLWAEVLNLGGYDLLITPFDRDEVLRVVCLAAGVAYSDAATP